MYNFMKRCMIVSIKFHKQFSRQSADFSQYFLSHAIDRRINTHWDKRFYCQIAINEKNAPTNRQKILQQKLDDYLSDPENKKVFDILNLEIEVLRHNAEQVPDKITTKDWLVLVKLTSKSQRKKYLRFLFLNEKSDLNKKLKKEKKLEEFKKVKIEAEQIEDTGEMKYGLRYNSLFLRIYDSTMNRFYNNRTIRAMMFEPKIVFDCGYNDYMTQREMNDCAKQLILSVANNRIHVNPMSLYFCNMQNDGMLFHYCSIMMPNIIDDDFPATITSQSYLDMFPKEQLVYLTPHCRTEMTKYNPDFIYIIGAIVDKSNHEPLSLAKAKKEGLQMAKLPLDRYLSWGSSSGKNLTLNQMTNIMLDIRHTKDWNKALKHIPNRKLKVARDKRLEHQMKRYLNKEKVELEKIEESNVLDKQKTICTNISNLESNNEDANNQVDFTFSSRRSN